MAGLSTHDIFYGTDTPSEDSGGVRTFQPQQQQLIGGPTMRHVPTMPTHKMRTEDVAAERESDPS